MAFQAVTEAFESLSTSSEPHADITSQPTSFTLFPKLPQEIRDMIFDFALTTPAVVSVEDIQRYRDRNNSLVSRSIRLNGKVDFQDIAVTGNLPSTVFDKSSPAPARPTFKTYMLVKNAPALRRTCKDSRSRAIEIQSSFLSNGNIFGNLSVDTLWLTYPSRRPDFMIYDQTTPIFPTWDGPKVPRMALDMETFHLALTEAFSPTDTAYIRLGPLIYGLYVHGTEDLSLVYEPSSSSVSWDYGILFMDPGYTGSRSMPECIDAETLNILKSRYGSFVKPDDAWAALTWQGLADAILFKLNHNLKKIAEEWVPKNEDGTFDFEATSQMICYDMCRDFIAGNWGLKKLQYVEATTYHRDAEQRAAKVGRYKE